GVWENLARRFVRLLRPKAQFEADGTTSDTSGFPRRCGGARRGTRAAGKNVRGSIEDDCGVQAAHWLRAWGLRLQRLLLPRHELSVSVLEGGLRQPSALRLLLHDCQGQPPLRIVRRALWSARSSSTH